MDADLCDELLQDIFQRLPPPSSAAVSLVCKRWLRLVRSATSSLTLSFSYLDAPIIPFLTPYFSHYPYLSSLSISTFSSVSADHLLLAAAGSCRNLHRIFLSTNPVTASSLLTLSNSCHQISFLSISIRRPLCFRWLPHLRRLKHLSLRVAGSRTSELAADETPDTELNLESLCLSGVKAFDHGLNYLWRNCKEIRKLELKGCEGVGDTSCFSGFLESLNSLECVELRRCRNIVEAVLFKLGEHSSSLKSLLVYDGGSKEGFLHFIRHGRCHNIQTLDLRLPLDLHNNHLIAISEKFRSLSVLRLQGCYLSFPTGLEAIAQGSSNERIEELSLVNCDVIERYSGLLTMLGQGLKRLRKLDLSYNELLVDKELTSMLFSCDHLRELRLRGCGNLTTWIMVVMAEIRPSLEVVDVMSCRMIGTKGVEILVKNGLSLRSLYVEDDKVSDAAKVVAANKCVEIVEA